MKSVKFLLPFALLILSGCDEHRDAFVSKCQSTTGASSSDCKCAADKVKEIMGDQNWKIMGLTLAGNEEAAEVEAAKLGIGGMFSLMSKWGSAISVAERQCSISGLQRM